MEKTRAVKVYFVVVVFALRTGALRSDFRVPPASSYSVLFLPYSTPTAASITEHLSVN